METHPAFDERPLDDGLKDVAASAVYVLLMAHRYGWRPPVGNLEGRSITQLEYQEAGCHEAKPRLVFTPESDHPWPPRLIDQEDDERDQSRVRSTVEERHGVTRFTTPDHLSTSVDLERWVQRHQARLSAAFLKPPSVQDRQGP